MKANLKDLNNMLFEQLERLNDDELKGAELDEQLKKSAAINNISSTIIQNYDLVLKAYKVGEDTGVNFNRLLIGSDVE